MVGWRYLSSDPLDAAFDVYANGRKVNGAPIRDVTFFKTPWRGEKTTYEVRLANAPAPSRKGAANSWTLSANAPVGYFDIELSPPPASVLPDGKTVGHHPCDCSVGDLDGDGEDDLVVIWWPDNAGDNASWHVTGETWLEGVKLDGSNRSLWKINLSSSKPSLAQMSEKAIELLSAENQNGFFLMVEGAHIDKNADDSQDGVVDYPEKKANTAEAVKTFDDAVQVAVNFARTDGHTLVVITADHETGDLRFDEDAGCMTFHSASHTGANVPVFVYGATDLFESGAEIDNRDIVNLIAHKLGWRETFPIEDPAREPEQPTTEPDDSSQTDTGSSFDFLQWLRHIFKVIGDFWRRVFKIN